MKKLIILLSILYLISNPDTIFAQQGNDTVPSNTFELGEVTINGSQTFNESSDLKQDNFYIYHKNSVSSALDLLPGVSVSMVGGRNEAMIYIRGYDLRRVPVFIDGMPIYVPYDGYIDLARLQSSNVSKISVSKGFSSILYGVNSMGGAINIISSKPVSKFELNGFSGLEIGNEGISTYNTNLSIGGKFKKWYTLANFSLLNRDYLSLSKSFDTLASETDRKRDNSFTKDIQYQLKLGFEPIAGHEYVISYSSVRSEKGVPVYLGANTSTKLRYWQYPDWDKDCFYFHSKSTFSEKVTLKTRLFYDKYYNVLESYDNNSYATKVKASSFTSIYDDNSLGGSLELQLNTVENNNIKIAVNSKFDHHKEYNKGQSARNFKDNSIVYGIEDTWKITSKLNAVVGIGYFSRYGILAEDYASAKDSVYPFPGSNDNTLNYQAGLFYTPKENQSIYLTFARKSRFATMKDRYSYRFGSAIPNPDLKSEQSINTELGYNGNTQKLQWSVAAYYYFIDNTIQQVNEIQPGIYQLQNTGRSEFRGFESGVGWRFVQMCSFGASYSFIDQKNISNPDLKFVDIPKHKLTGYFKIEKKEVFNAMIDVVYNSERYSSSDGLYIAPEYTLLNFSAEYTPFKYISIRAGVQNIFDKLYYVTEGYPEEGRIFHISLSYKFSR